MQFRDLYCIRFGCDVSDYERDLIHRYMSRRTRLLAPLLGALNSDYLMDEEAFAQCLGRQCDRDGVLLEVNLYHAKCVESSFARKWLGLRLHCRLLMRHALEMMPARDEQIGTEVFACNPVDSGPAEQAQG